MDNDVVVVTSRLEAGGERSFRLEAGEEAGPPALPEDLRNERELVELMRESGFQLTMVAGGSRPDEVRRFYFRRAGRPGDEGVGGLAPPTP